MQLKQPGSIGIWQHGNEVDDYSIIAFLNISKQANFDIFNLFPNWFC